MAKHRIGFIGGGNMGEALIGGILEAGFVPPARIWLSEPDRGRRERLVRGRRVRAAEGNADCVRRSDLVVLAVKPQQLPGVLAGIAPAVDRSKLLVSIAAGWSLAAIANRLGRPARLARAMPNTPALVGEGVTALAWGAGVRAAEKAAVRALFGSVGAVVEVDERLMNAVTGLSGSGPAYAFTVIQALADGGVQAGLPREAALELAARTLAGAASMVLQTGEHPLRLRDRVASPAGTTIRGIAELENRGVPGALMAAVVAAALRSRELSEES